MTFATIWQSLTSVLLVVRVISGARTGPLRQTLKLVARYILKALVGPRIWALTLTFRLLCHKSHTLARTSVTVLGAPRPLGPLGETAIHLTCLVVARSRF